MIKVNDLRKEENNVVSMFDMPLGSIGVIVSGLYKGGVVRRTCSMAHFLVESFDKSAGVDACWDCDGCQTIMVKILPEAYITVTLK